VCGSEGDLWWYEWRGGYGNMANRYVIPQKRIPPQKFLFVFPNNFETQRKSPKTKKFPRREDE